MKKSILRITLLLALPLMVLSSCIKDELPNTDADILDIELDKDVIIGKKIENDRITVFITPNSYGDLTNIKPTYVLSEGSKIIRGDDNYDYSSAHEIEAIGEKFTK